jgi:hypothetical protein
MRQRPARCRYATGHSSGDPNVLLALVALVGVAAIPLVAWIGPPPLPAGWPSWPATGTLPGWPQLAAGEAWLLGAWAVWLLAAALLAVRLLVTVALGRGDLHLAHTPASLAWAPDGAC